MQELQTASQRIRVVSIPEFIRSNLRGTMALPKASELLRNVLATSKDQPVPLPVLFDMRDIAQVLPVDDALTLVNQLHEHGYCGQRIAIVYRESEREHRAALVNLWTRNRQANIRAFCSYEEAVTWLEQGDWWDQGAPTTHHQ